MVAERGPPERPFRLELQANQLTVNAEQRLLRLLRLRADVRRRLDGITANYHETLEPLVEWLTESLAETCHLRLLSDDCQWLIPVASYDRDPELAAQVRSITARVPVGIDDQVLTRRALESSTPLYLPDLGRNDLSPLVKPEYRATLQRIGIRCVVVAPMRARGRAQGLLYFARRSESSFDSVEIEVIAELADQVAVAIDTAKLLALAEKQSETMREARTALQQTQAFLDRAQEVGRVGSWRWDPDHGRLSGSREACRAFGLSMELFDGSPATALRNVHPDDRTRLSAAFERAILGGALDISIRVVDAEQQRFLHVRGDTTRSSSGGVLELIGVVQDVTEQRRLQAELVEAQRMDAVGRVSAGVAHDFNNMLAVAMCSIESARAQTDVSSPIHEDLDQLQSAVEGTAALTRQLLTLSRQRVARPSVIRVDELLGTVAQLAAKAVGEAIELSVITEPALRRTVADPEHITQALMNMVLNAKDAMLRGGRLELRAHNLDLPGGAGMGTATAHTTEYVGITVRDSGSGMSREVLERAFDAFFTTKAAGKGTGLGLTAVRAIADAAGGRVWGSSQPGHGASFTLALPRFSGGDVAHNEREAAKAGRGRQTILLVEDDSQVRAGTRTLLTRNGYHVLDAANGAEALAHLEAGVLPDLLLTDVMMPGITGRALAEQFAQRVPGLAVLYMSGYASEVVGVQGVVDPGLILIEKPFPPRLLLDHIQKALSRAATASTHH